ncbi:MAG: leucyl/phenylalanyl-tRNA--protein transferase [Ferruginibacter sp.]
MILLGKDTAFPPVTKADADGLLAIGGDLSPQRLLEAYRNGIFPWYNEGVIIQWWSPDPRFVLQPSKLKVSKSMKKCLQQPVFSFTMNTAFEQVIHHCKTIERSGQLGTWIQDEVVDAYTKLHKMGIAISAEAWDRDALAGGLYGIKLGNVFFGESMFSHQPNASKFAFISLVQQLENEGLQLIDCQVYTSHLESLGAEMIPRATFMQMLDRYVR